MDKFAEISRTTGSNKAAKDALFKTIDPKTSQSGGFESATATLKSTAPLNIVAQRSEGTKLPPIAKKNTSKM
jgi:4'-phosphopantetheinyl transferase EntD